MYNIFGSKWLMLHEGPMLSTVSIGQQHTLAACCVTDPIKVYIFVYKYFSNIDLYYHTTAHCKGIYKHPRSFITNYIQRLNNDSGFTRDDSIQVYQLIIYNTILKFNLNFFN